MGNMMTSVDLGTPGKMICLDPPEQTRGNLIKVPRKLKKKMKKEGSWGMPVFTVTEMPMNFIKDFEVWKYGKSEIKP
ncbi:hypothetical protein [Sphingobacterium sp. 2149]|uniref:hypothetical protein n=1 Tax=Sphingobacterium sp. 2149 TaxID=2817763 RepID=UPI002863FD61|nr:hypothetical protein [Sphingobacterium sp. 2149]MDR6734185.1 hypothetical protein [Sphingobacterium sp. 2149]